MSAKYYADMSDMRDAGGLADEEFVLSDDYAALESERDALRERCEKLEKAGRRALKAMCNAVAPNNEFTDAVDELDAGFMEFGTHGGCSMHGGWTAKGAGPAIWFGHGAGKPDLTGKPLLDAVRELLDVRATPQGRAPWAGLRLMQMDARG